MSQPNDKQPVVVVLGAGRSGTSMTMEALACLGMRVSADMIEPNETNPRGFFESRAIVKAHKELLDRLDADVILPPPPDWTADPAFKTASKQLKKYLAAEVARGGLWGFKDPRTSILLPLWQKLFEELNLDPKYVLCVRHPASIAKSLARWDTTKQTAELIWLQRTIEPLIFAAESCFVCHYECMLKDPMPRLRELAEFVGLTPSQIQFADAMAAIQPALNHSNHGKDNGILNAWAKDLYALLLTENGVPGNPAELRACANKSQDALTAFAGWPLHMKRLRAEVSRAHRSANRSAERLDRKNKQLAELRRNERRISSQLSDSQNIEDALRSQLETAEQELVLAKQEMSTLEKNMKDALAEVRSVKTDLERARDDLQQTQENKQALLARIDGINKHNRNLKQELSERTNLETKLQNRNIYNEKRLKKLETDLHKSYRLYPTLALRGAKRNQADRLIWQLASLRSSLRFALGDACAAAIKRPGRRTFALPFTLIDILLRHALEDHRNAVRLKEEFYLRTQTLPDLQSQLFSDRSSLSNRIGRYIISPFIVPAQLQRALTRLSCWYVTRQIKSATKTV